MVEYFEKEWGLGFMKFLVHINDFNLQTAFSQLHEPFLLNSATSVNQLKLDYFKLLSQAGSLLQVSDEIQTEEWQNLCRQDDVIFSSFHEEPIHGAGCRFLKHSLGSLMVVGGYLGGWEFRDSSCNLVTSKKQALQLRSGLAAACPNLGILVPSLNTDLFRLPTKNEKYAAREAFKVNRHDFHLVYAGRIISNKGLVQMVRALNLWPIDKARLSVVGSYEPDFLIHNSNTYHTTFFDFINRELFQRSPNLCIHSISARPKNELMSFYWSSDCFLYPSFHEDENFGIAPREAILCGLPAVVTDFCGLGELAECKTQVLKTYPTLSGIRYSLHELRQKIYKIKQLNERQKEENQVFNSEFVANECDQNGALNSLKIATGELLKKSSGDPPAGGWRSKDRIDRWAAIGPESFKYAIDLRGTHPPDGLFVDGSGFPENNEWYSDTHFQKAIHSFYTTIPQAPKVKKGENYRGFWRIALWPEEKALVEFGYPGPRLMRFKERDWENLVSSAKEAELGEVVFSPVSSKSNSLLQLLIEYGYLVPDRF